MTDAPTNPKVAGDVPKKGATDAEVGSSAPFTVFGMALGIFIERTILVVILPVLAFLAKTVVELNTTVTAARLPEMSSQVSVVADRVSRIYDVFPELQLRVAEDFLLETVNVAILTQLAEDGKWRVSLIDADAGRLYTFTLPEHTSEAEVRLKVRGLADEIGGTPIELSVWRRYAHDAGKEIGFPKGLNEDLSFGVIRRDLKVGMKPRTTAVDMDQLVRTFARLVNSEPTTRKTLVGPGPIGDVTEAMRKESSILGLGNG